MLSRIFEQIAKFPPLEPLSEKITEASLRGIVQGPREIAFEKAISAEYHRKRAEKFMRDFTAARTPESRSAVAMQYLNIARGPASSFQPTCVEVGPILYGNAPSDVTRAFSQAGQPKGKEWVATGSAHLGNGLVVAYSLYR